MEIEETKKMQETELKQLKIDVQIVQDSRAGHADTTKSFNLYVQDLICRMDALGKKLT
nr:hypothetical protein Itr_chr02CG08860 [Ipomoea trifida]